MTECIHPDLIEGPRFPLLYGSAKTELCKSCGYWRYYVTQTPSNWRTDSLYEEIELVKIRLEDY